MSKPKKPHKMSETEQIPSRRSFFSILWIGLGFVALIEFIGIVTAFILPRKKMAKTGGVMGVTTLRAFVRDEDPVTVEHVIDHIDHIVKLTGIEHAGIGSDADLDAYGEKGMEDYLTSPPHVQELYRFRETIDVIGLDHPKRMYDLTEALIRRGYSDENIELLIGGNFARMLAETWKAAPPAEVKDKKDA